jgi:RimJ/RimL family protein N-acetyltransferase
MSARRLTTDRLDLITATAQHVLVAQQDATKLGRLLGADLPSDWPPAFVDDDVLRFTLDKLHRGPDQIGWWMRYVVLRRGPEDRPMVVGVCGYKGPPADGRLEIGYSIVEGFRNRGFATEIARALTDWAFEHDGVERVVAHTLPEHGASIRVLEKCGYVSDGDGDEEGTVRYVKPRAAWAAEGPVSRRVPKLVPPGKDVAVAGIPKVAREIFDRFLGEELLDADTMRAQIREHVARIEAAAADNPYVDDVLARDIARVCEGLLDAVVDATPEWTRRQIQAASRYFVTEEDGDSDLSIGGLDEDAAVANAVARHLGRADLLSDLL